MYIIYNHQHPDNPKFFVNLFLTFKNKHQSCEICRPEHHFRARTSEEKIAQRKSWILEQQTNPDSVRSQCTSSWLPHWQMPKKLSSILMCEVSKKIGGRPSHNFEAFLFLEANRGNGTFRTIRDWILSFVGRRLYFQFPASTNAHSASSKTSSCLEKKKHWITRRERTSATRDPSEKKNKIHIHFHPRRLPLRLRTFWGGYKNGSWP